MITGLSKTIWQYLLATDGVNQLQRSATALEPSNVKLDDRSMSDLIRFVYQLSTQIKYFGITNVFQGNWQSFFDQMQNAGDVLPETDLQLMLLTKTDLSPHLALLLAYLKAYLVVAGDLNGLTKKRLDYYYEQVLKLQRIQPQPDEVHVLFELGKNAKPTLVKQGSLIDAGKTSSALPLQYALENEIVVNHSTIGKISSSLKQFKTNGQSITFKANDATTILNETGSGWQPFGESQFSLSSDTRTMEPVSFGWAIASPNFLLAEGKRTVKLTMSLTSSKGDQPPLTNLNTTLDISFSGEKEWLSPDLPLLATISPDVLNPDPTKENPYTLTVTAQLSEVMPAVTKYDDSILLSSYPTEWPVMRILLKPDSNLADLLSIFHLNNVQIEVEAKGVKKLILQNDQAIQAVDKPIFPFGGSPIINSNFYIGSQEIFSKTLTSITVNLEWQDPPSSFSDYYKEYQNNNIANNSFSTAVDLLSNKNWNLRLVNKESLFNLANTANVQSIFIDKNSFSVLTSSAPFKRDVDLALTDSFDSGINQGFLRLVLVGPTKTDLGNQPAAAPFEAFGHKTFPFVFTDQMLALSKYDGTGTKPELPKPAFTPVLKSITVDYTASDQFTPNSPNLIEQFFTQDIFGPAESEKDDVVFLVAPQPGIGALYIGLENADAPQSISFLFQIEEGNVQAETLLRSSDINWSYLAGNHWTDISPSDVLENSTEGFQKPGVLRMNIGSDATKVHSLMPKNMRWIRGSVIENYEGAASIIAIHTQAAKAKLIITGDEEAYAEHLSTPLVANTISKMVVKIPAIKKLQQPYPSFGGHNIESDAGFYRRISERLRHKNRAVAGWDFERLVLEKFPEIYKLKCLAHSDDEEFFKPGNVRLVVVPDWRKRPTGDPLQPRVSKNRLREIADLLSENYASAFAKVYVSNPTYETLLVDCKVSFHPQFDPGFYSVILEEDIKRFLSPWAYEEGQDIVFGGKIHASEILGFIEGRDYVDFVIDFELYHHFEGPAPGGIGEMEIGFDFIVGYSPDPAIATTTVDSGGNIIEIGGKTIGKDFIVGFPVDVAAATRPDTILVSNSSHRISAMQASMSNCQGIQNIGIGQMIVGLDFIPIS